MQDTKSPEVDVYDNNVFLNSTAVNIATHYLLLNQLCKPSKNDELYEHKK